MSAGEIRAAQDYLKKSRDILDKIAATQMDSLRDAAEICTRSISEGGLVHLFGTGHSRIAVEEMFPRHGSFPGFHPIVELSLTNHTAVVGPNGQRQAMFLEHVEGLGEVILSNFVLEEPDSFMIFSNSGVNEVVVEVAAGARKSGLPVIAVVSLEHCRAVEPRHSSGNRLTDLAQVVIDNCSPAGDALVRVEGLDDPVGPGSTIGVTAVVNAVKCLVAEMLSRQGQPPLVLSSSCFLGEAASRLRFEECYNDYRRRVRKAYGCQREEDA